MRLGNVALIRRTKDISLEGINASVPVPRGQGFWRMLWAYTGPGTLVAVGYMDPGNWVTSIGGGQQYNYLLLSVILLSSLIAMLLQFLSAKLGIVTGLDLAQATRRHTGRYLGFGLWLATEAAIMATDIAEVVGAAIALHLLFGIPLVVGVFITILDVFLLLLLVRLGFRKIEALVTALIATIAAIFAYEVAIAGPHWDQVAAGFIPSTEVFAPGQLSLALGIVGATVMPHNLYLGSSLVQSRALNRNDRTAVREAIRFAGWDSNLQLTIAFFVNCLLLILGAALFYGKPGELGTFGALYDALQDPAIAGAVASPLLAILFAVALLASGQNSTITGTLAGQIVMEGFLRLRLPLWARRLLTRLIAVLPVLGYTIAYQGSELKLEELLVNSQIFLCIALPITMVPLVYFTSRRDLMGEFVNRWWTTLVAWLIVAVLTYLNLRLIFQILSG